MSRQEVDLEEEQENKTLEQLFMDYFKNNNQEMFFSPGVELMLKDIFTGSTGEKNERS